MNIGSIMAKFLDCFDREFIVGEDVIYGVINHGKCELLCGIVTDITETELVIDYQRWKGEEEIIRFKHFKSSDINGITKIKNLYKIFA